MDLRPLHLIVPVGMCAGGATAFLVSPLARHGPDAITLRLALGAALATAVATVLAALAVRERERRGAAAERRRIARDLHDGLAQELAFLVTQAQLLCRARPDVAGLSGLEAAAQRALDETRLAIGSLTRDASQTLVRAVEEAAEEVAHREGVKVELDLDATVDVTNETRDEIVRIVREATTNAIRHGRASALRIALSRRNDAIQLQIVDDGAGFDPSAAANGPGRFGLISMNERARAVGGDLRIVSEPGAGTRVEVAVR